MGAPWTWNLGRIGILTDGKMCQRAGARDTLGNRLMGQTRGLDCLTTTPAAVGMPQIIGPRFFDLPERPLRVGSDRFRLSKKIPGRVFQAQLHTLRIEH